MEDLWYELSFSTTPCLHADESSRGPSEGSFLASCRFHYVTGHPIDLRRACARSCVRRLCHVWRNTWRKRQYVACHWRTPTSTGSSSPSSSQKKLLRLTRKPRRHSSPAEQWQPLGHHVANHMNAEPFRTIPPFLEAGPTIIPRPRHLQIATGRSTHQRPRCGPRAAASPSAGTFGPRRRGYGSPTPS